MGLIIKRDTVKTKISQSNSQKSNSGNNSFVSIEIQYVKYYDY